MNNTFGCFYLLNYHLFYILLLNLRVKLAPEQLEINRTIATKKVASYLRHGMCICTGIAATLKNSLINKNKYIILSVVIYFINY